MKKNMLRKGIILVMLVVACGVAVPTTSEAKVKLGKKSVTLLIGKTTKIKIKGTKKKATWKSSKKSTVEIIKKSKTAVKIKAIKKGKSTISAKVNGKKYKCTVNVVNPKISKTNLSMTAGATSKLAVSGGTGAIRWKSSNTSVATVSSGIVTAKKAGMATITAVQNKRSLTCTVTVKSPTTNPDPEVPETEPTTETESEGKTGEYTFNIPEELIYNSAGKKLTEIKTWINTPVVTGPTSVHYNVYILESYFLCLELDCGFESFSSDVFSEHEMYHILVEGKAAQSTVKEKRTLVAEHICQQSIGDTGFYEISYRYR